MRKRIAQAIPLSLVDLLRIYAGRLLQFFLYPHAPEREGFKQWLLDTGKEFTPNHKLNPAIDRWAELGRYLLNGALEIDNE
ncbi:MAG: hypothetical protein AAGN35_03355 [Bacteroidota bacterium]